MNIYGVVILVALLADYALHTVSETLNLRALDRRVPASIASLYGRDELDRAKHYVRAATAESLAERSVVLLALLVFWFAGGFDWLDGLVRQWFAGELVRGLAYIGLLALGYVVISLPFDIYRTFVTENRFGFNLTTPRTFILDRIKSLGIAVAIGGLLLAGVLLLFLHAGSIAWLLCWITVVAFSLVTQWLGPVLILPLFNRFDPMPDGELRETILRYARSVRFPLQNVYVMDGSRRSSKANAYFTGLGRQRRIALFDTLLQHHTRDEIVAILAHEVGHYRMRHVTRRLVLGAVHTGIAFFLLDFFLGRPGLYEAFYLSQTALYTGFVCFGLLYTPVETVLSILANVISRRHEYEADRFAVDTAPSPEGLAEALKKLYVTNLAHPNPHGFHVFVNYSHPPVARRIQTIDEQLARRGVAA